MMGLTLERVQGQQGNSMVMPGHGHVHFVELQFADLQSAHPVGSYAFLYAGEDAPFASLVGPFSLSTRQSRQGCRRGPEVLS